MGTCISVYHHEWLMKNGSFAFLLNIHTGVLIFFVNFTVIKLSFNRKTLDMIRETARSGNTNQNGQQLDIFTADRVIDAF